MSNYDVGAPQLPANQKYTLYNFLEQLCTTTYNTKTPTTVTTQFVNGSNADNGTTVHLTYATAHGYREGALITISGANEEVFNKRFRVKGSINNNLTAVCYIIDNDLYPSTATGTISTRVSPLEWDVAYKSASQITLKSKHNYSSKTCYTFSNPVNPNLLATQTIIDKTNIYEFNVSENVNNTTGALVNSLTAIAHFTHSNSTKFSPYVMTLISDHTLATVSGTNLNAYLHNVRWTIISDGRFMYILLGNYANNLTSTTAEGSHPCLNNSLLSSTPGMFLNSNGYWFGDLNGISESNTLNGNNVVLNMGLLNNSTSLNYHVSSSLFYSNTSLVFPANHITSAVETRVAIKTQTGINTLNNLRDSVNITYSNFGSQSHSDSYRLPYPYPLTNGILFQEVFLSTQNENLLIGSLPSAVMSRCSSLNLDGSYDLVRQWYGKVIKVPLTSPALNAATTPSTNLEDTYVFYPCYITNGSSIVSSYIFNLGL
jgi:hypothetical protein